MILCGISIFISAFLIFLIQPMSAKFLLPFFGGTPCVWSTVLAFFQLALTGGYAYAYWLSKRKNIRKQGRIHLFFLLLSAIAVMFVWAAGLFSVDKFESLHLINFTQPTFAIFLFLVMTSGIQFFLLASNSSLLQTWMSSQQGEKSPFLLYAISNSGSIIGLFSYPIIIEKKFSLIVQSHLWLSGYLLFVLLTIYISVRFMKKGTAPIIEKKLELASNRTKFRKRKIFPWILLSACSSVMLLAVTNQITQEVAAIPYLWTIPLSIYLLSFVLICSYKKIYRRKLFVLLLAIGTIGWFFISIYPIQNYMAEIIIYGFLLFAVCMVCHGEIFHRQPESSHLTFFYLMISIGGVMGGILVNFLAPLLFKGYWELYFGMAFLWLLLFILYIRKDHKKIEVINPISALIMAILSVIHLTNLIHFTLQENSYLQRNFFGVVHVRQRNIDSLEMEANLLVHGSTIHGLQIQDNELKDVPTCYYSEDSGIGLAIQNHPKYENGLQVGVLGMGIGTLAAYGQPGDHYRFYEINPSIIDLANGGGNYFSFLQESPAAIDIIKGDARVMLENETNTASANTFDILVLDTFNSDSIPVHMLTREAFAIYLQNISEDGLIAAHITNTRLDLSPVFWQIALHFDLDYVIVENQVEKDNPASLPSTWFLMAQNTEVLESIRTIGKINNTLDFQKDNRLWTDDYSNVFQVLK